MLDGVGEEESLVATGGAADHLAVVYATDDQVKQFDKKWLIKGKKDTPLMIR